MSTYKLYSDWTAWWPLVHPPEGCAPEAAEFYQLLQEIHPHPVPDQPQTMVEFGCGGGGNASYLKTNFMMTLVDLSPEMLTISRDLNPECEHLLGDMRSVRLGRQFDVVFIHDAIMYMTTESDLRQALATAYCHCKPGGVALFYPDGVRENFHASCDEVFGEDNEEYGLRYIEWIFDPNPADTHYAVHFGFLLRKGNIVEMLHEEHTFGLFAQAEWLHYLREAGFQPEVRLIGEGNICFVGHRHAQA